jgi:hypothetical protein
MTGVRKHARYNASGSHRWMHCAGALELADTLPAADNVFSGYAFDGTEAHELAYYALSERYRNAREAYVMSGYKWTHYYDHEDERLDSVQEFLDYVYGLIDANGPDVRLYLEVNFQFPTSLPDTDVGGTADVVLYFPASRALYVVDFKHGAGYAVNANHNSQLKFYIVGALAEIGRNGLRAEWITGVIVQPRAYHSEGPIREWFVYDDTELPRFIAEVDAAIVAAQQPGAPRTPGEWCEFCPVSFVCPEFEGTVSRNILPTFNTFPEVVDRLPAPADIPLDRLDDVLRWGKIIARWYEEMQDFVFGLAGMGVPIPGRKLVYTYARRKWNPAIPKETILTTLSNITGKPKDELIKLVGITQAETMVRDALRAIGGGKKALEDANEAMAFLTLKEPSSNLSLVADTDKRPGVNPATLFANVVIDARDP